MAAVLRASGTDFDPDKFCAESSLEPCSVYRRGELMIPDPRGSEGRKNEKSGVNIRVSEADFHEFCLQVEDATAFLATHKEELSRLCSFPGIEASVIDFGIARRDVIVQSDFFPPALIRLAGELGLGIELSQYPIRGGNEAVEEDDDPDHSPSVK